MAAFPAHNILRGMPSVRAALVATVGLFADMVAIPLLLLMAIRFRKKENRQRIGIGPEPLIGNANLCSALRLHGLPCETYVHSLYHVTTKFDHFLGSKKRFLQRFWVPYRTTHWILSRYDTVFHSFVGGGLASTTWAWRIEPFLYRVAGIQSIMIPYGADVYDFRENTNETVRTRFLLDYPEHSSRYRTIKKRVDIWSRFATKVVSGCDWIPYTPRIDLLMLSYFCVSPRDYENKPVRSFRPFRDKLRVLHAPNHRFIKGTDALIAAIDELQSEGIEIQLELIEREPNESVKRKILETDIVADQFVLGWYAMFSIEAMASGKPTLCYLADDLLNIYRQEGLLKDHEPPLINTSLAGIKDTLRSIAHGKIDLAQYGRSGPPFVAKHHSLNSVGRDISRLIAQMAQDTHSDIEQ